MEYLVSYLGPRDNGVTMPLASSKYQLVRENVERQKKVKIFSRCTLNPYKIEAISYSWITLLTNLKPLGQYCYVGKIEPFPTTLGSW